MSHEKEAFRKYLKQKGLKFTREREAVVDDVASRTGHFDLEEVASSLRNANAGVSRASVYRTLPLLVESGIVEEVERTDKHAHYERTFGRRHHDHMLCDQCGRVIEFFSPELEDLQERLCRRRGFSGTSHFLEIRGLCRECGSKKGSKR